MFDWIAIAKTILEECAFPDYTFKVDVPRTEQEQIFGGAQ